MVSDLNGGGRIPSSVAIDACAARKFWTLTEFFRSLPTATRSRAGKFRTPARPTRAPAALTHPLPENSGPCRRERVRWRDRCVPRQKILDGGGGDACAVATGVSSAGKFRTSTASMHALSRSFCSLPENSGHRQRPRVPCQRRCVPFQKNSGPGRSLSGPSRRRSALCRKILSSVGVYACPVAIIVSPAPRLQDTVQGIRDPVGGR
jgi:hypothetical protein